MSLLPFHQARILLIDDQIANLLLLEDILRASGYVNLQLESDSRRALEQFLAFQPDLIVLDLLMPEFDGFEVLAELQPHIARQSYLPILILTADDSRETRRRALSSGARDFLSKPIDMIEVVLRIQNLLETRFLHLELERRNERLREEVHARTLELEQSRVEMLQRLASAVEYRDDETGEHTRRVGETAARIAQQLRLPADEVELIRLAAPLHDMGKIGISDFILRKRGPLTSDEYQLMRTHTTIGGTLLAGGQSRLIQLAEQIALTHHERWDGLGYPHGLAGEAIPLVGRIVAVADVFDALIHDRPYKPAWPIDDALAEIGRQAARQFDPQVVAAFLQIEPVV